MRVAVWEFFCSGASRVPASQRVIQREGKAMLLALVGDILRADVDVTVVWDAALGVFPLDGVAVEVATPESFSDAATNAMADVDQVVVIAPESDGLLLEHHHLVSGAGADWCGTSAETLQICSDKLLSFERLTASGVPTVPATTFNGQLPGDTPWVIKPRFGAGCDETFVVRPGEELPVLSAAADQYVVQPLVEGKSISIAAVWMDGGWSVLPLVEQRVVGWQRLEYHGGVLRIDGQPLPKGHAKTILSCLDAVRGDRGWIGIDLIEPTHGPAVVVDINPRLTTSYIGYRQATDCNLAELLLNTTNGDAINWRPGDYEFGKE